MSEPLTINLGTGIPTTVLQLVHAFSKATGIEMLFEFKARREGDISISYTNPEKAQRVLSWKASKSIHEMCEDAWRWKQYESRQK